MKHKLLK